MILRDTTGAANASIVKGNSKAKRKKKEVEVKDNDAFVSTSGTQVKEEVKVQSKPVSSPEEKASKAETGEEKKTGNVNLKFIHVNDFHGYAEETKPEGNEHIVGGIARTAGEIKELKSQNPEGTVLLDGGDGFDGGFYSKFTQGQIISEPYKELGFDAMVIGNHDLTWGLDAYAKMSQETGAQILGANVLDLSPGQSLKFLKPYTVIEREGVKIGVLGITTQMTALGSDGKVQINDAADTTKKYIDKMKKDDNVDMVVVLSHLGHDDDVKLAGKVDGIDLIVGSHSHTVMRDAEKVGNALIVQAGGENKYVGNMDLVFDPQSKKIVSYKETLIPITADIKPDPAVEAIISPFIEKYESVKNEVLAKTPMDLPLIQNKRTALHNLFVDAQLKDADLAVTSSFSLRKGLEKGDITFGNLFQMYPFDNELVKVKVKGDQVLKFLEGGVRFLEPGKDNYALVSGMEYKYNPDLLEGNRITEVTVKGKKMTREDFAKKNFNVNMDNYTFGKSYFKDGKQVEAYGKVFDILKEYLTQNPTLKGVNDDLRYEKVSDVPDPSLLNEQLGSVTKDPEPSQSSGDKFTCAAKFFSDAIKGDADMSFGYNKSLQGNMPEGNVDKAKLKKLYPFPNELYKVEVPGKQILNFIEGERGDRFKGKEHAISSGINYTYDSSKPEGKRIQSIKVGDKEYTPAEFGRMNFTVSMDNFMYDAKFKGCEIKEEKGSIFENLCKYVKENSPLNVPLMKEPPGVDIAPQTNAPTQNANAEWERTQKILSMGAGKIKPDEVNQFSLSKVETQVDSTKAFETQEAMLRRFKKDAAVTMYTLEHPKMLDALIDTAKRIPVRVAVDPHIHTTPEKLIDRMENQKKLLEGGVKVAEDPADHIFCNHSKTLSGDGTEAYVAKINWADYSEKYHDYGSHIEGGKAVNDVENFQKTVLHMSGFKEQASRPVNADVADGVPVKVLVTNPDSNARVSPLYNVLNNIDETHNELRGQYFSLTEKSVAAKFMKAKEANPNLPVKLLLNEGIFLESGPAQKLAQQMMDKGIEIKLYKDEKGKLDTLHAATTMFDKNESTLGSANFTFGGLRSNREVDVNIVDEKTLEPVSKQFDYDWEKNSREITPDDLKLADKEKDEDAKPYYDTPIENIAKVMELPLKKLEGAIDKIYETVGFSEFNTNNAVEIKLVVQKLASFAYKDEAAFDKTMDRFIKILASEVKDTANPEKANAVQKKLTNDVREALGDYIVINNIAMNKPEMDRDDLTDKFLEIFDGMNGKDANGASDETFEARSVFANTYGID